MESNAWAMWAESILRSGWRDSTRRAIEEQSAARWHPNGFVVFRLDDLEEGSFRGSRRIHIWPSIPRRSVAGHPTIHSHDWELQSLVLHGSYKDVLFEESGAANELVAHEVTYDSERGDKIEPTGRGVRLVQSGVRVVEAGQCHHMPVGLPHETLVEVNQTVVTHVMMGPRQDHGMMLAGQGIFRLEGFERPSLDSQELEYATHVLGGLLEG